MGTIILQVITMACLQNVPRQDINECILVMSKQVRKELLLNERNIEKRRSGYVKKPVK